MDWPQARAAGTACLSFDACFHVPPRWLRKRLFTLPGILFSDQVLASQRLFSEAWRASHEGGFEALLMCARLGGRVRRCRAAESSRFSKPRVGACGSQVRLGSLVTSCAVAMWGSRPLGHGQALVVEALGRAAPPPASLGPWALALLGARVARGHGCSAPPRRGARRRRR